MFVLRVKLSNGTWADVPFPAAYLAQAIQMCESQYGRGSFMGVISEG